MSEAFDSTFWSPQILKTFSFKFYNKKKLEEAQIMFQNNRTKWNSVSEQKQKQFDAFKNRNQNGSSRWNAILIMQLNKEREQSAQLVNE